MKVLSKPESTLIRGCGGFGSLGFNGSNAAGAAGSAVAGATTSPIGGGSAYCGVLGAGASYLGGTVAASALGFTTGPAGVFGGALLGGVIGARTEQICNAPAVAPVNMSVPVDTYAPAHQFGMCTASIDSSRWFSYKCCGWYKCWCK